MRPIRVLPLLSVAMLVTLSACQTITDGIVPTGKRVLGEVQWGFAASSGDIVTIELSDHQGVMVAQELLPTPGAKHVPFDLVAAKDDLTRCKAGGSCRYRAKLLRGDIPKAVGEIYYTGTSRPVVRLITAADIPAAPAGQPEPVNPG